MILFFEYGRLGNQLFQYCGLKKCFPEHKMVFLGCSELEHFFEIDAARFIRKDTINRLIPFGLLQRFISFLVVVRILGRITEESDSANFKLIVRKGLVSRILVPLDVFFQHRDVIERIENPPILKAELLKLAKQWLDNKGIIPSQEQLVFVHIRRGDYLYWPSKEFPAVLNFSWYRRAMNLIRGDFDDPVFVLMSDDQYYLRDVFEESHSLVISDNAPEIDLAIMSLCSAGILSASSFGWWGAFYARARKRENAVFIAPEYWGGHRLKKWYPAYFGTEWITYIE